MNYLSLKTQPPKHGQLCIVKCPGWSPEGYVLAVWKGYYFDFPDQQHPGFMKWVKGYLPINNDGLFDMPAIQLAQKNQLITSKN